jgi:hypothetical protein
MKKFLKPLLAICFASSLFSCANNTETAKEEPKKADSVAAAPAAAPVAFAPFKVVVIKHKVADYAKWRVGFDAHDSARKASGLTVVGLLRASENPNDILVANRISDLQKARDFAAMPSLREVMAKAGVIGKPDITFYETVRYDTSKVEGAGTDIVIVTHKVKDFDAWLKVYDGEGKDKRASEGMVDRVLARGVDDPNLVHIVFAVTDLAKAKAAITSEGKKKLMMSAGVEGKPDIVFYKSAMN